MDKGTAIIAIVMIAICVLPFVLIGVVRKMKKKQILNAISNVAKQENCTITDYEVSGDFILGIYENEKTSFFFKYLKDKKLTRNINLNDIKSCEVKTTNRNYQSGGENYLVIEKIEMNFLPVDSSKPYFLVEFYNEDEHIQLNEEVQIVETWAKKINEKIKQRKGKVK
jgi:hypothetical protein